MNGFNGMNMGMGWGMGFGWLIGIVVIVAVIWIISRMVNTNQERPLLPNKSALDILNERYARDEITKQEYEEKKKDIL